MFDPTVDHNKNLSGDCLPKRGAQAATKLNYQRPESSN
jgi:hypothetical protein